MKTYQSRAVCCLVVVGWASTVGGCAEEEISSSPVERYGKTLSPDGEVMATVYHSDSANGGHTQLGLYFDQLGCGTGATSWDGYDLGIELHWVDAGTLQVAYPDGTPFRQDSAGDYLGCMDRLVRLVMVPHSAVAGPADGTWSESTETDRTMSSDQKALAAAVRYDSPTGGITQAIVRFPDMRACAKSAATFFQHDVELSFEWLDETRLEIGYPEGLRFELPPWGATVGCSSPSVDVTLRPVANKQEGSVQG